MADDVPVIDTDFKRLKAVCVPLLGASRLTPASVATTSTILSELVNILKDVPSENLTTNLISYVFLPLSTILQRNSSADIPNQILEKILVVLTFLTESWWWNCDIKIWEQIFMLCGAVIGGIDEKSSSKENKRDDETKEAATRCMLALLHPRTPEEAENRSSMPSEAEDRLTALQKHSQNPKFAPIIGQTLNSLINSASSPHIALQRASLETIYLLIDIYLSDHLIPSVLPGVVSSMSKICLGWPHDKGWANGEIVARALRVLQVTVTKAIGDEVCFKDGALRRVDDLEGLMTPAITTKPILSDEKTPYGTRRTESWLRGSSTQLHIAINNLSPLLSHPTPSALQELARFSAALLRLTSLSLPQTQPLLLSFLLSLSLSDYTSVSLEAHKYLTDLLTVPSEAQILLQRAIMKNLGDNLSALPRLLSTQADARVTHAAGLIIAICRLASQKNSDVSISFLAKGISKILGPTGGIEKWGWSLLSVLEIVEPPNIVTQTSGVLENDPEISQWINFPELMFHNISSHETRDVLKNMLHALGAAGGDSSLFAVDWFMGVGHSGTGPEAVAALWCACRLLEGTSGISLYDGQTASLLGGRIHRRLEKEARVLAKNIAETWDRPQDNPGDETPQKMQEQSSFLVQHKKGINPLHETLKITNPSWLKPTKAKPQPIVHRALCLQLIAVAAGIAQIRFTPIFIHTLYPVLHSLVSPVSFLFSTALATLNFITVATSYASPANLLLSNFDYVLDSVSRRLTQQSLDIDATKVLTIMIRLVGSDVVEKAGDVVEECFDRLDEYHGYGLIVDGLIEVLIEVIKVVEVEARAQTAPTHLSSTSQPTGGPKVSLDDFFTFLPNRFQTPSQVDNEDYGPAPKKPWGEATPEEEEKDGDEEGIFHAKPTLNDDPPPTPVQALTKQIISRSVYFLTHDSPVIRARILSLLTLAVPVLPESALLPSIHSAWPFILNRFGDSETFVLGAAAALVEALAKHVGDFMFRRVWDDIWPKFRSMLRGLEGGESSNALARSGKTRIGTESAYTHSHRLYRSILKTMTYALQGVHEHELSLWEVIVQFRRFLSASAHEELQQCAVALYVRAGKVNPDSVWLALESTTNEIDPTLAFLNANWDIEQNAHIVLRVID